MGLVKNYLVKRRARLEAKRTNARMWILLERTWQAAEPDLITPVPSWRNRLLREAKTGEGYKGVPPTRERRG